MHIHHSARTLCSHRVLHDSMPNTQLIITVDYVFSPIITIISDCYACTCSGKAELKVVLVIIVLYNYSCNIRVEGIVGAWNMSG